MKSKKDISDLIRDNQHKLEERPSPRAWEKLEGKLDNYQSKSKTFLYRKLAMAAAVVALIAVISLLTVLTNKNSDQTAKAEANIEGNWMAQDLETISTDGNKNLREAIEFQRKLKNRYPNSIAEGQKTKKLLASNHISTDVINRSPSSSEPTIAMNDKPSKTKSISNASTVLAEESKKMEVQGDVLAKDEISTEANEEVFFTDEAPLEEEADIVVATDATGKLEIKSKVNSSTIGSAKKMNSIAPEMNWLVGKWKSRTDEIIWKKESEILISSENFVIKKENKKWSFIKNSDLENPYLLTSSSQGKMIFKNKNKDTISIDWKNENNYFIIFYNNSTYELERKGYSKF